MKRFVPICIITVFALAFFCAPVAAQIDVTVTDMTPVAPLQNPGPSSYQPKYISGFGSGDSFTLFFEDRGNNYQISYVSTTSGPTGFPASATVTNISDTHFCVKDWPINIGGTDYAYRAWGAVGNNRQHHFYVSNDLTNWTKVSTFTIPNFENFHSGYVYYGFHDVIELNGTYYAWGEGNIDRTLMCRSANGADDWEAFASVGGQHTPSSVGPLGLPDVGTPTGSFFELGGDRGYGKIMVPGNDLAIYLAINTAAKPSLPPAQLETAFIDPSNWMWHDGTTGLATTPILASTPEHDLQECWLVSSSDNEWTIIYDADFGTNYGGNALGYAILSAPPPSGSFVTGGGWIYSEAGSYEPDPSLEGKVNFGFVSRYKKGAEEPTGNTEFVFRAGNLNFHSSSYEWLVVNQAGVQFKGSGVLCPPSSRIKNPESLLNLCKKSWQLSLFLSPQLSHRPACLSEAESISGGDLTAFLLHRTMSLSPT